MSKTTIDFSNLQVISEHNLQQLQKLSRLNISYNAVKIPTTYDFILIARIAFDLAGEQLAIGAMDGGDMVM